MPHALQNIRSHSMLSDRLFCEIVQSPSYWMFCASSVRFVRLVFHSPAAVSHALSSHSHYIMQDHDVQHDTPCMQGGDADSDTECASPLTGMRDL